MDKNKNAYRLFVSGQERLKSYVKPYVENHKPKVKLDPYLLWREALDLVLNQAHLTHVCLEKIRNLKISLSRLKNPLSSRMRWKVYVRFRRRSTSGQPNVLTLSVYSRIRYGYFTSVRNLFLKAINKALFIELRSYFWIELYAGKAVKTSTHPNRIWSEKRFVLDYQQETWKNKKFMKWGRPCLNIRPDIKLHTHLDEYQLGHYLAGLIEGDGYFGVKKLEIAFHGKDKSSAYALRSQLGYGQVYAYSRCRNARLVLSKSAGLERVFNLVNGKLVHSAKVYQLQRHGYSKYGTLKPNSKNISLRNHWLAGFIDADGSLGLFISHSKTHRAKKSVRLEIKISQKHPFFIATHGRLI